MDGPYPGGIVAATGRTRASERRDRLGGLMHEYDVAA
jgi:hypothetical protein